ncbi:MAG: DedA family protein [Dialister micraerophilus]|uniref:DedA family protein n=1 Tax=Dialister micraerophilus TaxID=309120 RepID=UPI00254F3D5B|nr:DedA family protein [Dialister micraerophilus]MDK8253949.1 DedA family protein [Dialister micraerophilus]
MELIISFLSEWGYSALFVTMALENMNVPIPSEIILGFAGFLVSQQIFSFWPTVIVATIAGVVGSILSYWIGATSGRLFLLKIAEKNSFTNKKLQMADAWFKKYGGLAVFTGRLLPGIRTFISLPAGISHYPLVQFVIYTIIGTIPWTLMLIYIGDLLGENWHELLNYKLELALFSIGVLIIALVLYFIIRQRKDNV